MLSNKGNVFAKLGKYNEAIKYFEAALKIKPDFATSYLNIGSTYMEMKKFEEASENLRKAREIYSNEGNTELSNKVQMYETWANNTSLLMSKLNPLDERFLNILKTSHIKDLKDQSEKVSKEIEDIVEFFKNLALPNDAKEFLNSKRICFTILNRIIKLEDVNFYELQEARNTFKKWNLENFIIAVNSIEIFFQKIRKYDSIEEIPEEEQKDLLVSLRNIQILDGILTSELSSKIKGRLSTSKPKFMKREIKVDYISLNSLKCKNFIRICLVPLDFELTKTFPNLIINKEAIKVKIQQALNLAKKNNVNIICFPELSFDKDFLEDVKDIDDLIIISGSFYDENFYNKSAIYYNGNIYPVYKINPAPYLEDRIDANNCMKCGNEIKIFFNEEQTLRFTILICIDFYIECWKLFDYEFEGEKGVNLIFVPSFNDDSERFQRTCDTFCENYTSDVLKISNLNTITCIFGRAHKKLIERLKNEGYRKDDEFRYKLCEAFGEMMLTVDLYMQPIEIPTSLTSSSRIKIFKRYNYNSNKWEEI